MSHGVVHFEIPADDPDTLGAFYEGLFGWKIDKLVLGGTEYWAFTTVPTDDKGMPTEPGGINGGMMRRQNPGDRPVNYVDVESVDEYARKAQSLGATVALGKTPVPGMGWFATVVDPQGNTLGLWQTDSAAG